VKGEVPVYAMKVYRRSRGIALLIPNFISRQAGESSDAGHFTHGRGGLWHPLAGSRAAGCPVCSLISRYYTI
jgi:hypothetical protein